MRWKKKTVFERRRSNYSSASDEYSSLHNKRQVFVRGRIPSPNHGQVFVRWTNTLSKTWGNYSSHGGIPSPKNGASIRSLDEYPLQHMGQVFVPWTNTLPKTHGATIRPLDEYPLQNMYGASICPNGRISSAAHGANIRTMDEYTPIRNLGQVLARGRIVPIFDKWICQVFVKSMLNVRIRAGCATLQAAWYIRYVRWACLFYMSFKVWFLWTVVNTLIHSFTIFTEGRSRVFYI